MNLELQEDVETALPLLLSYMRRGNRAFTFGTTATVNKFLHLALPESRVEGIADVSSLHRARATKSGGVIVTKDDNLNADGGCNVYSDDPALKSFEQEFMPCTPLFQITCWTGASYAPRGENGRSELYYVI